MKGIDISYYQGNVNFTEVAKDGIGFVILRDGYGSHTDKKFFEYATQAKVIDLPILGIYHFSYALNAVGAKKEALYAVSCAKQASLPSSTVIFYDYEYDTVNNAKKNGVNLTKNDFNEFAKTFCETVREEGYVPGIYMNKDYYKNYADDDLKGRGYVMWLADYEGKPDYPCDIQQTGSKGKVNGIAGNVDTDELLTVDLLNNQNEPTNTPAPAIKTVDEVAQEVIDGKWGISPERQKKLEAAGYNYREVQDRVNSMLKEEDHKSVRYQATGNVWVRSGAGTNKTRLAVVEKGSVVLADESKNIVKNGTTWLYISVTINGKQIKGYSSKKYYKKL